MRRASTYRAARRNAWRDGRPERRGAFYTWFGFNRLQEGSSYRRNAGNNRAARRARRAAA